MKLREMIFCIALCFSPSAFAKTLTVAVDVSASSGVFNPTVAKLAAARTRNAIAALQLGDVVRLQKFGERNVQNLPGETIRITRAVRPAAIAERIGKFIEEIPATIETGDGETNIIAYLEFGSHFDCTNSGKVMLISDGIESSSYISTAQLLAGKPLPPPESAFLKGCDVEMFPLGQTQGRLRSGSFARHGRHGWRTQALRSPL
jgi:hypothetical protein